MAVDVPDPSLGKDGFLWKDANDDDYQNRFLTSKTWDQVRIKGTKAEWSRVVWLVQGVPRFVFLHGLLSRTGCLQMIE